MMGFGAYGNGGSYSSSSSSNLTASAPQFTVNRSVPKPPSNPLVDLTEPSPSPFYAASLHNSGSKLFSDPSLEFSSVPFTNVYNSNPYLSPLNPYGLCNSNPYLPPLNPYGLRLAMRNVHGGACPKYAYVPFPSVYSNYNQDAHAFNRFETRCGKEFQHSDYAGTNLTKSNRGHPTPTTDVPEIVNTLSNLSETLLLCELKAEDFAAVKSVIVDLHTFIMYMSNSVLEDNKSDDTKEFQHSKSNRGQSTPTADVPGLLNTMSNLSELLHLHCVNGPCELKEKEFVAVKSVMTNLDRCLSKYVEKYLVKGLPMHYSQYSRKNISRKNIYKLNEVHKSEPDLPSDKRSDSPDLPSDKRSDSPDLPSEKRSDLDMEKEEKMTQALKKVLGDYFFDEKETQPQILFYKNLWLEAEAALCSINCKARFNRMKIEIEKSELPKSEAASTPDVCENTIATKKLSGSSRSEVSSDPNTVDVFSPEDEEYLPKEIQNSSIRNITSQADDVMARFHILRCPVDNSDSLNPANLDELSSSKVSPDPNKADKIPFEEHKANGSLKSDGSIQESTIFGTKNFTNDFEGNDNCSSICTEGQEVPEVVDLGYVGKSNHKPVIGPRLDEGRSDVKMESMVQQNSANSSEGKLSVKEFHLFVDGDPLVQSRSSTNRSGNQLLGGWDWEHVMKE